MKRNILIFLMCINMHACSSGFKSATQEVPKVLGFATDVHNFFGKLLDKDNESPPNITEYKRIISELSDHWSSAIVLQKTEIEAHMVEVRRSARAIAQLFEQIEQIIETKNQTKRQAHIKRFNEGFEQEKVNLYSLKSLLTLNVPGISSTLISLVANEVDCGMTGIENFQDYYMTLVSKAAALDLVYEKLTGDLFYNEKLVTWTSAVTTLMDEIEKEKDGCKNDFLKLAEADFKSINKPMKLFDNNQKRFSYLRNDVLFLGGRYCAMYLRNYHNIFSKHNDNDSVVVAAFGDNDNVSGFSKDLINRLSKTKYDRSGDERETQFTIDLFNVLGYDVVFLSIYPDNQTNNFQILLDKDTTANIGVFWQNNVTYNIIIYVQKQTRNSTTLKADDYDVHCRTSAAVLLFDKMLICKLIVIIHLVSTII